MTCPPALHYDTGIPPTDFDFACTFAPLTALPPVSPVHPSLITEAH